MHKVRITVLKTTFHPELADKYLTEGRAVGPCPLLKEGDQFIYQGEAVMPEGFCPWAWIDVYRNVSGAALGSDTTPWVNQAGRTVECCTDGIRPVIFEIQRLEETD